MNRVTKLLFSICILLLLAPSSYAERDSEYHKRVVQVLFDTVHNKVSTGQIKVNNEDVNQHLLRTNNRSKTYSKAQLKSEGVSLGEFRISVGILDLADLKAQWWKPIYLKKNNNQLWMRRVKISSSMKTEMVIRRQVGDLGFEILSLADNIKTTRDYLEKMFALLLDNAEIMNLFKTSKSSPVRSIVGTWSGPMENSKGDKVASSSLMIESVKGGEVKGAWHAGWKLEEGKFQDGIVSWKHSDIKGCKDYVVKMEINPDGMTGTLHYNVKNNCTLGDNYTGTVELRKE